MFVAAALISLLIIEREAIILASAARFCTDDYECCNNRLTENAIYCWGFASCCNGIELIGTAVGTSCDGAFSCHNSNYITSTRFTSCMGMLSCMNSTLIDSKFRVACPGESSCMNSNINVTGKFDESSVQCSGHESCINSNITTFSHYITGSAGLSMINTSYVIIMIICFLMFLYLHCSHIY